MAAPDTHVGTLLLHLNEVRHPTKLEQRLLQIQDEFALLRDSFSRRRSSSSSRNLLASSGTQKNSLYDLTEHLREQLELSKVSTTDKRIENTSFGAELLSKQIAAVIKKLNSPELKKQKKAFRVLDSLATSDTAVSQLCAAGGAMEVLSLFDRTGGTRETLHLIAVVTAFPSFRNSEAGPEILERLITLLTSKTKDFATLDLVLWGIANFATDVNRQFSIGQQTLATLIDLMSHTNAQIVQQVIKIITSITVTRANRKVIDAWEGFSKIVALVDSQNPDIMISALSALAHMASQETEPLFDHMSSYVRRVCGFVKSPASSLDLKAIACRCVANFSLLSKLRPLIIQEGTYEALVAFVAAEAENLEDEDRPLIPALEEAVAAINNILAKEKSLMDSVGSKLVHSLHRFLTSPQSSITLREQSAWILARILSDDKLRLRADVNSCVEPMVKLLQGEPREQYPAAWAVVAMASSPELAERIRELDGLIPLVKMLFSKDQDARLVSGKALSNLSASSKNGKAAIRHLFTKLSLKDNVIEARLRSDPSKM